MNSRQRFLETMRYGSPDRVPYFEEGIRPEVIKSWRNQGLPPKTKLHELFHTDERIEVQTDVYPRPYPSHWPETISEVETLRKRLKPSDRSRLPKGWQEIIHANRKHDHTFMLRVHRGFYQSMGVEDAHRFTAVNYMLYDNPALVHAILELQGEFATRLAERVLQKVNIDAAIFSEAISGNHGALISPEMYKTFVLSSYQPLMRLLARYGVETIILQTYANTRILLPVILEAGFNCLWAVEVNLEDMDYRSLRSEFGRSLRLIGGIDLDVLHLGKDAIRRELEEKVPPLLAEGGYIPLADGRVRANIPFENYSFYRHLLEELIEAK
jgi:hypothetical protein